MKKYVALIISAAMALSVCACGGGGKTAETTATVAEEITEAETTEASTEPTKIELNIPIGEDMTIVEAMYDDKAYGDGTIAVALKIKNNTAIAFDEVGFQFHSYDKNGDRVGSNYVTVSDMEAGHSTWTSNIVTKLPADDFGSVKIEYYSIGEVKDGKRSPKKQFDLDPKPEVLFEEMNKKE